MKKLLKDFRDFIMRGNVIDLAIGIIIGSAFSTLVNSVVNNLLMPPLGLLIGNVDFKDLFVVLKKGQNALPADATLQMAQEAGAVTFNYGQFLTDVISFVLLAIGVFLIIKGIKALENGFGKSEEEEKSAPTEKDCPYCHKAIPVEATRCPFCTSQLADSAGKNE
ncbi:large conductance mechanosensitive channel protein MscL [bacterium]|nr:large conductance mechanosensitive channel protein MscL [bacterium]